MQQVKVEMVGPKPLQAAFAGFDRAAPSGILRIDLADQETGIASAAQRLANNLLGSTLPVHLGGIDQRHAELQAKLKGADLAGALIPVFTHEPSALTQRGDFLVAKGYGA
jgi:hypothetical protein